MPYISQAKKLWFLRHLDRKTAMEITEYFEKVFPNNPLLGDFALFGYGVNHSKANDCD